MDKKELLEAREELLLELAEIENQLLFLKNMEKPYVACINSHHGNFSAQFKKEEQARKKLAEYKNKKYYKNGLNYGVYLFKWNEDGTKEIIEVIPLAGKDVKINEQTQDVVFNRVF
mgnify:CR=1 FL=1